MHLRLFQPDPFGFGLMRAPSITRRYTPTSESYFDGLSDLSQLPETDWLATWDLYVRRCLNQGILCGWEYPFLAAAAEGNCLNAGTAGPTDGQMTANGTIYHTAGGVQSDTISGHFNTNKTPAQVFTLTNGVIGAFKRTAEASGVSLFVIGAGAQSFIGRRNGGASNGGGIASNTVFPAQMSSDISGLHVVTASGTRNEALYIDGVSVSSATTDATSLLSASLFILANNNAGAPHLISSAQLGHVFFGSTGFSAKQVAFKNAFVEELMHALGRDAV